MELSQPEHNSVLVKYVIDVSVSIDQRWANRGLLPGAPSRALKTTSPKANLGGLLAEEKLEIVLSPPML